jgi:2-hydroxychromene-2-carboxylate isomerase
VSNLDRDDPALAITTPLRVGIDFKQPQSYLAKAPTQLLAATLGIEIDWQPMNARPFADPAAEMSGDGRGARHRRFRADYFERDLRRYAEAQGLTLGDVHRSADSSIAGMGLLWARKHPGHGLVDVRSLLVQRSRHRRRERDPRRPRECRRPLRWLRLCPPST